MVGVGVSRTGGDNDGGGRGGGGNRGGVEELRGRAVQRSRVRSAGARGEQRRRAGERHGARVVTLFRCLRYFFLSSSSSAGLFGALRSSKTSVKTACLADTSARTDRLSGLCVKRTRAESGSVPLLTPPLLYMTDRGTDQSEQHVVLCDWTTVWVSCLSLLETFSRFVL